MHHVYHIVIDTVSFILYFTISLIILALTIPRWWLLYRRTTRRVPSLSWKEAQERYRELPDCIRRWMRLEKRTFSLDCESELAPGNRAHSALWESIDRFAWCPLRNLRNQRGLVTGCELVCSKTKLLVPPLLPALGNKLDKRSPAAFEWFPMLCNKTEKWPPIRITIFNLEPGRGATIHQLPRLWRERRTSAAVLRVARDALHKAPCQHAVVE